MRSGGVSLGLRELARAPVTAQGRRRQLLCGGIGIGEGAHLRSPCPPPRRGTCAQKRRDARTSGSDHCGYDGPVVSRVFDFSAPDRFIADAVGAPGQRAFYLQARQGGAVVTVLLEKVQLAALAGRMADLLDTTAVPGSDPDRPRSSVRDDGPLQQPIAEAFRVGVLAIAWDPEAGQLVIEAQPAAEPGDSDATPSAGTSAADLLRVRIDPGRARDFVRRAAGLVVAGRPTCPFCGQPLEAGGHFCPRISLN